MQSPISYLPFFLEIILGLLLPRNTIGHIIGISVFIAQHYLARSSESGLIEHDVSFKSTVLPLLLIFLFLPIPSVVVNWILSVLFPMCSGENSSLLENLIELHSFEPCLYIAHNQI